MTQNKDTILKPVVVMDLSSSGEGGGPYTSYKRIMDSSLRSKYEFKTIVYKTHIGRFISFKRIRDLMKQIQAAKPDIVHFTGLQLQGLHISIACKLLGVNNTVITIHGSSSEALNIGKFKKFILSYILEPLTLLLVRKYHGVSKYVCTLPVAKLFSYKSLGYIYNLPPTDANNNQGYDLRKVLGVGEDDILVASVGRVIKDKGFHILEQVIKELSEYDKLKFIIIGDGNYLEDMKKNLREIEGKKGVFFLGYRSDIQDILRKCDIFVLPTLHETLSIALLEASTVGLPLVATNTGGIPEIVKPGFNGELVQPGNAYELKQCIINLINNKEYRKMLGKNAEARVAETFNREKILTEIDNMYQLLLKR